jgi:hypothetical protein
LTFFAVFFAVAADHVQAQSDFANEKTLAPMRKTYSQVFNFDDLTKNQVPLRLLLEVELMFYSPVSFTEATKLSGDDELGAQHRVPTLYMEGDRLFEVQSKIWSLTSQGSKDQVLAENTWSKELFLLEPLSSGAVRANIGPGYLNPMTAVPISLMNNNYLISMQLNIEAAAEYEKKEARYQFLGYSISRDERLWAKATLFQKDSGQFLEIPTEVPEGIPVNTERCERPGESQSLRPLIISGIQVPRVMFCYPDSQGQGFQRMILPWHKPLLPDPFNQDNMAATDRDKINFAIKPLWDMPIEELPETNCHGYSLRVLLGDKLEIPKGATWIQGLNSEFTESYVPLPFLLQKYFNEIQSFEIWDSSNPDFLANIFLHAQSVARPGDLVTFSSDGNFVHSGVLVKTPSSDLLWVQSKFAQGGVFTLPLELISNSYHYKTLKIFRKKSNSP